MKQYKFDTTKYINVKELIDYYKQYGVNKLLLITDNGTGKTYSATNLVMEKLLEGETCAWIRNTELEATKAMEGLNEGLKRYNMSMDYMVNGMGIFKIEQKTKYGTPKLGKLVCPLVYLSSLARSVPQEIKASFIVIDEFIDGNEKNKFVMRDYGNQLKKAINRLSRPIRKDKPLFLLGLANPHTPQCDLLYSLDLDFDWDKLNTGKTDYQYSKEYNAVGICIPKQFDIEEMKANYSFWAGKNQKNNYKFESNKYKCVKKYNLYFMDKSEYQNLYTVTIKSETYSTCFLVTKIGDIHYVSVCSPSDWDVPHYALTPLDKEIYNVYIIDNFIRMSKFASLINSILTSKTYYDTDFSYQQCKKLLTQIIPLARDDVKLETVI